MFAMVMLNCNRRLQQGECQHATVIVKWEYQKCQTSLHETTSEHKIKCEIAK